MDDHEFSERVSGERRLSRHSRERSERLAKADNPDSNCKSFNARAPPRFSKLHTAPSKSQEAPSTVDSLIRHDSCVSGSVSNDKRFVYVIRSERHPDRHYTGITSDVSSRIALHNTAGSGHTIDHRPWRLIVAVECADEKTAKRFERYLKSGSGRAFAKRHG